MTCGDEFRTAMPGQTQCSFTCSASTKRVLISTYLELPREP